MKTRIYAAPAVKKLILVDVDFFIVINIFRHLKLEIALAFPASNDEK